VLMKHTSNVFSVLKKHTSNVFSYYEMCSLTAERVILQCCISSTM